MVSAPTLGFGISDYVNRSPELSISDDDPGCESSFDCYDDDHFHRSVWASRTGLTVFSVHRAHVRPSWYRLDLCEPSYPCRRSNTTTMVRQGLLCNPSHMRIQRSKIQIVQI